MGRRWIEENPPSDSTPPHHPLFPSYSPKTVSLTLGGRNKVGKAPVPEMCKTVSPICRCHEAEYNTFRVECLMEYAIKILKIFHTANCP